ncbi:Bacterial regulatory protein, Fis family [compost metagenome]
MSSFVLFDDNMDSSSEEDKKNAFVFKFDEVEPLHEVEKKYVQFVFERNNRAKEVTARALGIDRKTLYRKLQEIDPSL